VGYWSYDRAQRPRRGTRDLWHRPRHRFYRDGCCKTGPEDVGSHTVCAFVSAEFLAHQKEVGNDLTTPLSQYQFSGLRPDDAWCVVAGR
jgi:uncharacterized protein (DUF2237 family)